MILQNLYCFKCHFPWVILAGK